MDEKLKRYASNLSELIKIPTISNRNNQDMSKFEEFDMKLLEIFPNVFKVMEVATDEHSLILKWSGSNSQKLPVLFMNHHDVVEASGEWKYPPFSGEIAEDRVWGRGTIDTKSGFWAMLQAADDLISEGFVPDRDIYFESACNEEITGDGANSISKKFLDSGIKFAYTVDEGGAIMYDPIGGADATFAMVGVGEKNCVDLKFIAKSNGGHASTPGKDTPLVRLGKFMAEMEKSRVFYCEVSPTVKEMFRRMSPYMKGALGFIFKHPDFFEPIIRGVMPSVSPTGAAMLRTTIAFTMAGGSEGYNVLPEKAWVTGNMRVSHHQGREDSIEAVRYVASKYDIDVEIVDLGYDSPISSYEGEGFKKVEAAIKKVYPSVVPVPYVMTGASDSRYFSRVSRQNIRFAPFFIDEQQLGSIHGVNENISLSSLIPAVDFFKCLYREG